MKGLKEIFMIRSVGRFLVVAGCLVAPGVVSAQAPWRQVYKDSDLTVQFDTATASLVSPGVWSTVTSWDYNRPRVLENKKTYTRLVEKAYLRCSPARLKRVSSTLYGPNNVLVRNEGEASTADQRHMQWDRPRRAMPGFKAFESVCGVLKKKPAAKAKSAKR
jgi:hypothetical protein